MSDRWLDALLALEPDKPAGAWGMSDATARGQLGLKRGGRGASRKIVEINRGRKVPDDYWARLKKAAGEYDLPPVLLCAIADRESNQGAALDSRGYGDHGHAFGVCQVDSRYHSQKGLSDPFSLAHLKQATLILRANINRVEAKHPSWPDKYVLLGAVVAYNSGVRNVVTIENMNRGTTGNDYGADVMARAQILYEIIQTKTARSCPDSG